MFKMLSSTILNNILASSSPQMFFPNLYVYDHLSKLFIRITTVKFPNSCTHPQVLQLNGSFISLPEKQRAIFKSLFRTLPHSKVNVTNHFLLYVAR